MSYLIYIQMIILASIKIAPIFYLLFASGLLGIAYSFWNSYKLKKLKYENHRIFDTSLSIKNAVIAYIKVEYKFLTLFALSLGFLLYFYGNSQENTNGLIAVSMLFGAISSAAAGYFSMQIATRANEKVTNETQKSYKDGFRTSFSAASSIGIIGASCVILGFLILLFALYLTQNNFSIENINIGSELSSLISGFALGVSSITLFARLGGGIFAKGADFAENEIVSTETGINEKSSHNAASFANETGQIISNIGGIAADIFESTIVAIIASMLLGAGLLNSEKSNWGLLALPLIIVAIGIFSSIAGSFLLHSNKVGTSRKAMNIAEGFAAIILSLATFFLVKYLIPSEWDVTATTQKELIITTYKGLGLFWSAFFGIAASVAVGYITYLFTGKESRTVKNIVSRSSDGPSNNVLGGIEAGLLSTGLPLVLLIAVAVGTYYFSGFYGIGIASVGYFGNMGIQLSFNAFAPIADNSNSTAIKAGLDEQTLAESNNLKITGIQSIAKGKNLLTLGASLTLIALLGAFIQLTYLFEINLTKPFLIASLLTGAVLPLLLSSVVMSAVNRISIKIVSEVKRQFIDIPELADAKEILEKYRGDLSYANDGEKEIVYSAYGSADNNQCVESSAYSTIWETLIPGVIIIIIPVLVAYFGSAEMLAAMLIGTIVTGTILSIYQANTGSALENTKYAIEEHTIQSSELSVNKSSSYQAALVGEKIGKPIKDVASPAVVVLMKLMMIVAIIVIPLLINKSKKSKALHVENTSIIIKHSIKSNPNQMANNAY